ncbi:hypothetical protein [Streptomyces sp. NPDC001970]
MPVVDQEMLLWEEVREPRPAPRSVLDLATAAPTPLVPAPRSAPADAAVEGIWASGYDAFCLTVAQDLDEGHMDGPDAAVAPRAAAA